MFLTDIQLTGFVLLPIALIGFISNWTAVIILNKLPAFRHSFGFLSSSQTIADAIHSTLFLIYFCPMVISGSQLLKEYSHHCGFLLLFSYELSVQIHLVIALNRFFAVWTPYKYAKWFSDWNTKVIIGIVWLVTFGNTVVLYEILCNVYYDNETGFFTFTPSQLCYKIGWYADFCKYLTIIIIIVITDISTVLKARSVSRKVNASHQSTIAISTRELNFLKQTVFQGSIFALELLTYFILPGYLTDKWAIFFATSFAWVAVHAFDGLLLMAFNPEIKKYILACGKLNSPAPSASSNNFCI